MLKIGKKRNMLYKDYVIMWLLDRRNYVKESTYANYSSIVYNHLIPTLGFLRLSDISNKTLQELILNKYRNGRIDNGGGLSDKTIKDMVSVLKNSLKGAMKEGLIQYINLDFSYQKNNTRKRIYVFSIYEQRKIITYVMNNPTPKNVGVLLTMYTGLRIGELAALKWRDIDFKRNVLTVNKTLQRVNSKDGLGRVVITNPKTKNANREIPINNEFALFLKKVRTKNDDYILTGKEKYLEPRTYRKYFTKFLKRNNINVVKFHSLRHTFATNCIRLGADYKTVSELLGHASVNITLNLYVHPQMSQKKKCINTVYKAFQ